MERLIRCINCDEIFFKTAFDHWPEYEFNSKCLPGSFSTIEKDDFQDFLKNHRGHRMEDLTIIEDSFVSEKTYSEPVKISYFKATNGKENFVIKKFRERIDEPLKYQLIFGDYSLKCISIEIQSQEIAKQLKKEFKSPPLPQMKIAAFIQLYRNIAATICIMNLERVPEDSSHPLEIYYKLDDESLFYLLRNSRHIFKGQEYSTIEEFIHRHKEDGVLLLKATYKIQISEIAKPERKIIPAVVSLEKKKMVEKE